MTTTLVGYFNDYNEARKTEQDLLSAGFRVEEVQIVAQETDGLNTTEVEGKTNENWWERFKSAFGMMEDNDRSYYEQAARRGGALLTVRVPEERTSQAADIIERHNPIDLDQRTAEWNAGSATATASTTGVTTAGLRNDVETTGTTGLTAQGTESVQLAEEELHVGKRAVQRGGVRIHTYTTERPVTEQVSLREEQAYVERHAVDRAPAAGEAAFTDRTIEVDEMGEEAVVSKQARVVEEVTVGKKAVEHQETITDTVRKQEVEVERLAGSTKTTVDSTKTKR